MQISFLDFGGLFLLELLANLSVLIFVVTSMLQMGFSLTIQQIIEPLKNYKLVVGALLANFLVVPLIGYLVILIIPLETDLVIGLALLAASAGAPFLPKLAQIAKGDQAFSVGLMVLLMGITVIYVPLVLPLLLEEISINPLSIAISLIILMIIPLTFALFTRSRYKTIADSLRPYMSQASSIFLILLVFLMLVVNWEYLIDIIGTGAIIALLIFTLGCFAVGYLFAGKDKTKRSVMGFGTAQRNISAALIVATQNFSAQPDVLIMLLTGGLVTFIILLPIAGELGRRGKKEKNPEKKK